MNYGAHTKLTAFSCTAFTAVCCDDVMTPDREPARGGGRAVLAEGRRRVVRFLGFQVTAVENGTDALRLARNRPFDLLILDVMLPGIDGFEIARSCAATETRFR